MKINVGFETEEIEMCNWRLKRKKEEDRKTRGLEGLADGREEGWFVCTNCGNQKV